MFVGSLQPKLKIYQDDSTRHSLYNIPFSYPQISPSSAYDGATQKASSLLSSTHTHKSFFQWYVDYTMVE